MQVVMARARRNISNELKKPRRGWTRVTLSNVPNPWREVLTGVPQTGLKIDAWLAERTSGKCEQIRYNTWDFQKPDDAVLFTLTWG